MASPISQQSPTVFSLPVLPNKMCVLSVEQGMTDATLIKVAQQNPSLTEVCFRHPTQITDVGLEALTQYCKQLKVVDLSHYACEESDEKTEAGVSTFLNHYPDLVKITFPYSSNDLLLIAVIKKHPHLQSIDLSLCNEITDKGLKAIGDSLPRLREINVWGCLQITGLGIASLVQKCSELTSLTLVGRSITNGVLEMVALCCPDLREALFYCCPNITDSGLIRFFKSYSSLIKIRLDNCSTRLRGVPDQSDKGVSDDVIEILAENNGENLSELYIRCSEIGQRGLTALAKYCPHLRRPQFELCKNIPKKK